MAGQMTPAEIACKVLEILDRDGWCRYAMTWREVHDRIYPGAGYRLGSHCLAGAWGQVICLVPMEEMEEAYGLLVSVIREQYPELSPDPRYPWMIIPMMNDHATEEEVRAVLEKMIANGS